MGHFEVEIYHLVDTTDRKVGPDVSQGLCDSFRDGFEVDRGHAENECLVLCFIILQVVQYILFTYAVCLFI